MKHKITDLFEIVGRGKIAKISTEEDGNTPLVSASIVNNGIIGFYDIPAIYERCYTLSIVSGMMFYHPYKFNATSSVFILKCKKDLTLHKALALLTVINKQLDGIYSYSNKLSLTTLNNMMVFF